MPVEIGGEDGLGARNEGSGSELYLSAIPEPSKTSVLSGICWEEGQPAVVSTGVDGQSSIA